jgi:hypothetical protein
MVVLVLLCVVLSLLIFPGIRELVITPAVDALMNLTTYDVFTMK